ncbi:hypothetical protein [Polyangium fumosum]|uniref:hypothetical protein n=1 Tax=Polyangium fumosum TaxID=889272 RepID=UPI0010AE1BFC|nr:hypothetical protein [Polyangium fumosum]
MLSKFSITGLTLRGHLDAFKAVDAPRTIYTRYGLGRVGPNGEFEFHETCPIDKLVRAENELCALIGPQKAFEMGVAGMKYAESPPGVTDIVTAMQMFDAAYHINHLENGVPMFDPETGTMREGIGHYRCLSISRHRAVMEVDVPYPCDFDRGLMQSWARRFERTALVTHLEPSVCRKNGAPRCRYEVSWK